MERPGRSGNQQGKVIDLCRQVQAFVQFPRGVQVKAFTLQQQTFKRKVVVAKVCLQFAGQGLPVQAAFHKATADVSGNWCLPYPGEFAGYAEIRHPFPG